MSVMAQQVAQMLDMLPEQDQNLAYELIKKLVLAWDPDFTKVTPEELKNIKIAEQEILNGETIKHSEINWN
ncbi:MAG: hypothetical protein RSE07_05330 [Oscillospiraceae bacterium]